MLGAREGLEIRWCNTLDTYYTLLGFVWVYMGITDTTGDMSDLTVSLTPE
jgi:hypothetical protein